MAEPLQRHFLLEPGKHGWSTAPFHPARVAENAANYWHELAADRDVHRCGSDRPSGRHLRTDRDK